MNAALVAAETLPMQRIPFGDLEEAATDICREQGSANRRIRREGKLYIRGPQSASLLQPGSPVMLSVVSLNPLEVRGWAEMLGRKERGEGG